MRKFGIAVAAICSVLTLGGCAGESGSVSPQAVPTPLISQYTVGPEQKNTDFSRQDEANQRAAEAASQFTQALEKDPTYAGLAIVKSGVRVNVVGEPSPAVNEAIAAMAKTVPVAVRPVRNSMLDLTATMERINDDADAWRAKGINLSSWGPAEELNTIRIALTKYRPEAAEQLVAAYGEELVFVSKTSEKISPVGH